MHAQCLDSLNGTQVLYTKSDAVLLLTLNAKTQRTILFGSVRA